MPSSTYEFYDLEAVNDQLGRVTDLPFYENRDHAVDSWDEFRDLPFLTRDEVFESIQGDTGFGGLYHEDTALTSLTPAGESDLMLEYSTDADLAFVADRIADILRDAGLEDGDVVVSCFSYTPFAGGYLFHVGLEELGANVFPVGPGNSERVASIIEKYDVDVLLSPGSFAMEVASKGGTDVDTLVCSGEPFSVIPGYREQAKDAFGGVDTIDYYGLSEVGPVASEDGSEGAMVVADDHILIEIVDPETGTVLPLGERGEVVVTHLFKESQPLVRYRTGDLSELQVQDGALVMPRGVFGRTDDMVKIKGVKVYPGQLALVFHGLSGLTGNYRIEVSRPGNTDHLRIECECESPDAVDADHIEATITDSLLVSPDELTFETDLGVGGMELVDERF